MEQKIIFKTYLYSRKKIICIWLIAGLLIGGIISLFRYAILGEDFSWAAFLIPIGVTVITSPFIYNIYRKVHYWGLMQKINEYRKPLSERFDISKRMAELAKCKELLDEGLITQEEYDEISASILGRRPN